MRSNSKRLKILFVFRCSELGGAEQQGLLLARFLRDEMKSDVKILGLGAICEGRVTELCAEYGLPWQAVPFDWPESKIDWLIKLIGFARFMRKERPDIILPYTTVPNVVSGLTWRFIGAKSCLWNQRDEGRELKSDFLYRWAIRLASNIVSNSIVGKEALISYYGITNNSIKVIHNGIALAVPIDDRQTWRARLGIPDGCFVSTMVANVHRYKDHQTLLYAWQQVIKMKKNNLHPTPILLLAGRFDDNLICDLREIACKLELGDSVRFLGKIDDIAGLLIASDLCIHSSKFEGLPNSIIEAMAAGLPVVASDIPGIREVVGSENVKYLAVAGKADDLADKISCFINNLDICETVGTRNRKIVKKFSSQKMCREMSEQIFI